ncbi:hypothetical protein SPI_08953 [Niveomyces insectorum RCEF 264]|uniref:FAR-17a/AIG1-like protein n=1 Tax=Niveomyces insectorum RCEF 264 TaxID=1081102 RepID=A0A167MGT4_9HYPO|nr:hypothetical protein SPI_08953 [Niveomyces insectorum RCEF 264]
MRLGNADSTNRFEASWLVKPYALGFFRALAALYVFGVLFAGLAWDCHRPTSPDGGSSCVAARSSFAYFSILAYWGQGFYFLTAAVHTFTYARSGQALFNGLRGQRLLQSLHAVLYTTVIVFPLVVTAVYWGRLYAPGQLPAPAAFDIWRAVSLHAINSALALAEIVLPRTPRPPWWHLAALLVVLGSYLGVAYLHRAFTGVYVYDFLDSSGNSTGKYHHSPGLVAAHVFAIATACAVVFILVVGAVALRQWLTERKKLPVSNKKEEESVAEAAADGGAVDIEMVLNGCLPDESVVPVGSGSVSEDTPER